MLYIDRTEEMPAQNGGESKKQKADSNENITEASEYGRKCILGQCGAVLPLLIAPVVRTEKTVRFRIIKVSMKTLIIAVRPC